MKSTPGLSYGPGYVIGYESPNFLIGRLLTLVDAFGLKENQEKAVKDLIRQEVWEAMNNGIPIASEINDAIHDFYKKIEEKYRGQIVPYTDKRIKVVIEEVEE